MFPFRSAYVPRRRQQSTGITRAVEEPVLPVDAQERNEILSLRDGARVRLAAVLARVDEGIEPDVRDDARPVRGRRAVEIRDCAEWEQISEDLVLLNQLRHGGLEPDVGGDNAADEPLEGDAADAALSPVADADGLHQRKAARAAGREKPFAQGGEQGVRRAEAVEPADGERAAVRNARDRFFGGDELCHWRSPAVTW